MRAWTETVAGLTCQYGVPTALGCAEPARAQAALLLLAAGVALLTGWMLARAGGARAPLAGAAAWGALAASSLLLLPRPWFAVALPAASVVAAAAWRACR